MCMRHYSVRRSNTIFTIRSIGDSTMRSASLVPVLAWRSLPRSLLLTLAACTPGLRQRWLAGDDAAGDLSSVQASRSSRAARTPTSSRGRRPGDQAKARLRPRRRHLQRDRRVGPDQAERRAQLARRPGLQRLRHLRRLADRHQLHLQEAQGRQGFAVGSLASCPAGDDEQGGLLPLDRRRGGRLQGGEGGDRGDGRRRATSCT